MINHLQEKEISNKTAVGYDSVYCSLIYYNELQNEIIKMLNPYLIHKFETRILEVGCGTANFLKNLCKNGYRALYGCDLSNIAIGIAKQKVPSAFFETADMVSMPYSDDFFDVIVYMGSLHHIAETEHALKEGFRILKPDGFLVICDSNKKYFESLWQSYFWRAINKCLYMKNYKFRKKWLMDPTNPSNYTETHQHKSEEQYKGIASRYGQHIVTLKKSYFRTKLEGSLFKECHFDMFIYRILNFLDMLFEKYFSEKSLLFIVFKG